MPMPCVLFQKGMGRLLRSFLGYREVAPKVSVKICFEGQILLDFQRDKTFKTSKIHLNLFFIS